MTTCDAVVIGLGAMGSAAVASLARRGCKVVGIERFEPGHDRGSSHGATRIIRQGYFEHPSYVPLVRAAYPLWRELAAEAGEPLLDVTGIVEIGAPDSELVAGTLAASRVHGLAHDVLDARRAAPPLSPVRGAGSLRRGVPARRRISARGARGPCLAGARPRGRCGAAHRGSRARDRAVRRGRARRDRARRDRRRLCDRHRRAVGEGAAARSSRGDPGDAPGARLVRAARAGAVREGSISGVPAAERGRDVLRLSRRRHRDGSRSQSTTTPTRPSTPTVATASYRRPTRR